jgi:hypothetical protein
MWPFKKKAVQQVPVKISFSQVDMTERFDDNQSLTSSDWIATISVNTRVKDPESSGLPPLGANDDEIYRIASRLSSLRESIHIPNDGVYCPICHIANIDLSKLRTPCPHCQRALLKFGWD